MKMMYENVYDVILRLFTSKRQCDHRGNNEAHATLYTYKQILRASCTKAG